MSATAAMSVAWLSLAPVKSLRLHEVDELHLGLDGVEGDRQFLLSDGNGHLVNAKRVGALMQVVAERAASRTSLTLRFPDGEVVGGEVVLGPPSTVLAYGELRPVRAVVGPWSAALSSFVGFEVRLVAPVAAGGGVDRFPGGGATLLSVASVDALALAAQVPEVDRRRFRMNVGLDGAAAFEEDGWIGRVVAVGEASIRVKGNVGRCAVTTENPLTGIADLRTLHLLGNLRAGVAATEPLPFGVWGEVVGAGRVRVGDAVRVV